MLNLRSGSSIGAAPEVRRFFSLLPDGELATVTAWLPSLSFARLSFELQLQSLKLSPRQPLVTETALEFSVGLFVEGRHLRKITEPLTLDLRGLSNIAECSLTALRGRGVRREPGCKQHRRNSEQLTGPAPPEPSREGRGSPRSCEGPLPLIVLN